MVAKTSSHDTKWGKQEGSSYPWERKHWQPMATWKQIYKSQFKDLILKKNFSACQSDWNGEDNVKFYLLLLTRNHRQRSDRADFGKNSSFLPASASPRMPAICRLWSMWGVSAGLNLVTRHFRGGEIVFPLLLIVSAWLRKRVYLFL